jgi:hypothetical protein
MAHEPEAFKKYKGKIGEIRAAAIARNPNILKAGQSKGGKTTQERKKFKDILIKILDEKTKYEKDGKEIEMTRQEKLCYEVLGDVGNKVKALGVIRDTINEKPTDRIEMKAEITPDKAMAFSNKILGIKPTKADTDNSDDE